VACNRWSAAARTTKPAATSLWSVGGGNNGVSGGRDRTAEGEFDWVAGSLIEDQ
jgi:hypothetical protein